MPLPAASTPTPTLLPLLSWLPKLPPPLLPRLPRRSKPVSPSLAAAPGLLRRGVRMLLLLLKL
jgi:hypothetical protein